MRGPCGIWSSASAWTTWCSGTDLPFDMALDLPLAALADALTEAEIRAVAVANPRRLFGLG
ncbi:MAG TPA: hypothetical protein VKD66_16070 [Streptosporangiaceae bacterium]|nr:hypothetical protein [Streptosporangiaceae bacterium]